MLALTMFVSCAALVAAPLPVCAQDNYEIQVYGSDTVAPQSTMVELHSNFTLQGTKPLPGSVYAADRMYPTDHAEQGSGSMSVFMRLSEVEPWAKPRNASLESWRENTRARSTRSITYLAQS